MARKTHIKICCISSLAEARLAAALGADMLGLVGPMPDGPGVLDHDTARTIAQGFAGPAAPILLTSSATADAIAADAARVGVSRVQVVRHIDRREADRLAALDLTYIQVIHVEDNRAPDRLADYAPYCDGFLLDSGRPSQNTLGGTGLTHDWRISAECVRRADKPVFLAGGLTPLNVADAIGAVRPDGIDICSGVRRGGMLDEGLLRSFMQAAASADQSG